MGVEVRVALAHAFPNLSGVNVSKTLTRHLYF
jgi:hypothetical protein